MSQKKASKHVFYIRILNLEFKCFMCPLILI